MDWNPLKSSLFTGAGTPWGPKEYGRPEQPKFATPDQFQGFDTTDLAKQMERSIRSSRMRSGQALQGRLSKMNPYGASSDVTSGLAQFGAETEGQLGLMQSQLAQQSYQDQVRQADAYNKYLMEIFKEDSERDREENRQRGGFWGSLLGTGAGLAGQYLGGKAFAAGAKS